MITQPPRIYTCSEWGARPAGLQPSRPSAGIVIHHTALPNRSPEPNPAKERDAAYMLARRIQAAHIDGNGWVDSGQHFTISRGGVILEGRRGSLAAAKIGKVIRGAHVGVAEINATWWGIELEGTYHQVYAVTEAQWKAMVDLCAWLSFWGKTQSSSIKGHQEFKPTSCPGLVMQHLSELRTQVRTRKLEITG